LNDRLRAARDAAGWELCLRGPEDTLAGQTASAPVGEEAVRGVWPGLNRAYQEKFGLAPEQATPPPS